MTPKRSGVDWLLEGIAAAALVAAAWELAMRWNALPARIPTHFGIGGHANGWGGRNSLLTLLGATVAMFALLTAAEKYQRLVNIPIKVDREAPGVKRLIRSLAIAIKAVLSAGFFWITHVTIGIAMGERTAMGPVFLPLFLAAVLVPVFYYTARLKKL
jgi:type IV secretory pathway VirB6-like protein